MLEGLIVAELHVQALERIPILAPPARKGQAGRWGERAHGSALDTLWHRRHGAGTQRARRSALAIAPHQLRTKRACDPTRLSAPATISPDLNIPGGQQRQQARCVQAELSVGRSMPGTSSAPLLLGRHWTGCSPAQGYTPPSPGHKGLPHGRLGPTATQCCTAQRSTHPCRSPPPPAALGPQGARPVGGRTRVSGRRGPTSYRAAGRAG